MIWKLIAHEERTRLFDNVTKIYGEDGVNIIKEICDSFGFESTKKLTKQQYFNLVEAVNERMVKDEIQEFRKQKRRIANYTVDKGSSVKYKTIQNQDCAYVQMAYFMKENGNYTKSFQEYILVKENGKWKILSFQKNVSKDESKTEEQKG